MTTRNAVQTQEIIERLIAGHSPKDIATSLGIPIYTVYNTKKCNKDLYLKLKHQRMDGSPDTFPPGYGCESVKRIEPPVEKPVEKPVTEQPRHSFGELFEKIKRLENRNKELEEQLQEKLQEKVSEPFSKEDLLGFMVKRTMDEETSKEELMGVASTIDFIINGKPNPFDELFHETGVLQ